MSVATVSPISPVIQSIDLTSFNTIRTLSMDAIQAANSGHPGTPMALAPVALLLVAGVPPLRSRRSSMAQSRSVRVINRALLLYSLLHLTEVRAVSKD
jgi:transketolase